MKSYNDRIATIGVVISIVAVVVSLITPEIRSKIFGKDLEEGEGKSIAQSKIPNLSILGESIFEEGKSLEVAGRQLDAEEKFRQAIDILSKAILDSANAQAFGHRGWCYIKLRDFGNAMADFESGIKYNSKSTYCYNGRAVVNKNKGNIKEAIADYTLCINLAPQATYYSNRGNARNMIGDFEAALEDYDNAIKINSKESSNYYNKANTLLELGRYKEALQCYNMAIKFGGNDARAYKSRAVTYELLGKSKNSEEDFTIFKNLTNADVEEFSGLAYSYMKLGRFNEAIDFINQAIKLDSQKGLYFDILGDIYSNMNNLEEAENNYRKARQLGEYGSKFWSNDKSYIAKK